ncbi:hypothetical protein [uncultured Parabacteroides sp.]|uniref:hypothetical protein n=1 Tax=uncultured Parabacteroides sp. TaxID=512312 RepID=UPI00265A4D6A|nr:hypothetical protein [uncultured Parabacteroides sp.]
MKNLIFLLLLFILTLSCSSPKENIRKELEHIYKGNITTEETSDGTKYTLLYSVLEEDKFNTDCRAIKEHIDKITGSLPTTEIDQMLSKDQKSMSDIKAWETPTIVVLLSNGTRLIDNSNDKRPYIIDVTVREK